VLSCIDRSSRSDIRRDSPFRARFRAIDAFQISLTVDEGDNVFKDPNSDLLAILNSGADRMTAKVMRSEKNDDGKFVPREFNSFAPVALTSIRELPETLQDRSIVVPMRRAMKHEKPIRLTMRTRGPLIDIGRQFSRWAADLKELPDPAALADLFNRIEDRWFVLFQIARLAGGDWPERCRKAALVDLAREEASDADGGVDGDLLASVWEVFHAKQTVRIFTKDICAALIAISEAPWGTANRGQPVNEYYLKTHLKDFLPADPDAIAPRKWRDQGVQLRGFHQKHFEDAFARYLGKGLPVSPENQNQAAQPQAGENSSRGGGLNPSVHPSHPSNGADNLDTSDGYGSTDGDGPSVHDPSSKREVDGSRTDQPDLSAQANDDDNQYVHDELDGWTDGMDESNPLRESNFPPPHPEGRNPEPPTNRDLPRGARGRGKSRGEGTAK
jgi:hypothetical protein